MRLSLHRRRNVSLPPTRRRSPKLIAIVLALTSATVAFAASRIGRDGGVEQSPAVRAADAATRDVVDERIRVHLHRLERGSAG